MQAIFSGYPLRVPSWERKCIQPSFLNFFHQSIFLCRGSKKNSTSVPEDLQRLAPEQGLSAVDEVTVVPNLHPDVQQDGPPPEPPGSRAHVYFKDLSISIHHDDESEEDEPISGQDGVNSEQLSSPESKGSMTVCD